MTGEDSSRSDMHEGGSLWRAVLARTAHAAGCGALHFIPTDSLSIEQGDVAFVVRVAANFEKKWETADAQRRVGINPFLPYDQDLFVADISETHVCLLNKFNAISHHLLIVTREFEDQESPLGLRDFEALATCMDAIDGLGFYNAGRIAGASQDHKHLQLVPLPLGAGPDRTPVDHLLAAATLDSRPGKVPGLPFAHAAVRLGPLVPRSPAAAPRHILDLYRQLLREIDCERRPRPYNLLVTSDWMLAVPRSRECFESISVNALGFAGSLFARDHEELQFIRSCGPMTILQHVALA